MTSKKNASTEPAEAVEETVAAPVEETKVSRFAELEAEALADYEPADPYVIDHVDPPIYITEPVESDRVVSMALLYRSNDLEPGKVDPANFHPLLRSICGDAYQRVWSELLAGKHLRVAYALMADIQRHFKPNGPAAGKNGVGAVPGGSSAS